jgi:hypothetical protein
VAIADCAAKSAGLGLNAEALLGKLIAFTSNAGRARRDAQRLQPSTGQIFEPAEVLR